MINIICGIFGVEIYTMMGIVVVCVGVIILRVIVVVVRCFFFFEIDMKLVLVIKCCGKTEIFSADYQLKSLSCDIKCSNNRFDGIINE